MSKEQNEEKKDFVSMLSLDPYCVLESQNGTESSENASGKAMCHVTAETV